MILYRCKAPTNFFCPCGKVARALKAQGIDFEQIRVPKQRTPEKRAKVFELTGQGYVPVLVDDDGSATHGSEAIIARVRGREAIASPAEGQAA
jgi:glutathione S-transferase